MSSASDAVSYLIALFRVLEVEAGYPRVMEAGAGSLAPGAGLMVSLLSAVRAHYESASVYELCVPGRLIAEVWCIFMARYVGKEPEPYSSLAYLISGLPEWAWKYSSLDYVSAGDVPLCALRAPRVCTRT